MKSSEKLYYLLEQQQCTYIEIFDTDGIKLIHYNKPTPEELKHEIGEFCKIFGGATYDFHIRKARNVAEDRASRVRLSIENYTPVGEPIKEVKAIDSSSEEEIEKRITLRVQKQIEEQHRMSLIDTREVEINDKYKRLDESSYRIQYILEKSIVPLFAQYFSPVQSATMQGNESVDLDQDKEEMYHKSFALLKEKVDANDLLKLSKYIHSNPNVVQQLLNMIPNE